MQELGTSTANAFEHIFTNFSNPHINLRIVQRKHFCNRPVLPGPLGEEELANPLLFN